MEKRWDESLEELIDDTKTFLDEHEPEQQPREETPEQRELPTPEARRADRQRRNKKRKKRKALVWIGLLLLLIAAFAIWFFSAGQPTGGEMRLDEETCAERKAGTCSVLLAGTDEGGMRTDTMLLLHLDASARKASLISLPRDTYIRGSYGVAKLNSALGAGGGGEEGMQELLRQVTDLIGYRPDGYALIDLDGFVDMIDLLGGIKFDVPQDMYYNDPTQDLHIDLKAGMQRLNGEEAMGVVRYRSGYAQADLRRVEVQRDFLKAAAEQYLNIVHLPKAPLLVSKFAASTTTDLSSGNLMWIARTLLSCDREQIQMQTLPGVPRMRSGVSYYLVNAEEAAQLLNECANPYQTEITADMLKVRG
ncbi:MAG: LCP family protein [Oscillospiraceae bacterium]|nr:LCP family protein [Oscillospiraceae bacterium]